MENNVRYWLNATYSNRIFRILTEAKNNEGLQSDNFLSVYHVY